MLLEEPVTFFQTDKSDNSFLKTFTKPFNNDLVGYSTPCYKQMQRNSFLVYSDIQMEHGYSSFLKLSTWFDESKWAESLKFFEVGVVKYSEKYFQDTLSILASCQEKSNYFVSNTFIKSVTRLPKHKLSIFYDNSIDVNTDNIFFKYHKQRASIFDLSATRYSIMGKTVEKLWVRDSFQRKTLLANEGLPVDDFLNLMESYTHDLIQLLVKKNIEVTSENLFSLHCFSHYSQQDHALSSFIVELGFERKLVQRSNRWLDLIQRGITTDFIQSIRLANITVDHEEHLIELLDLWKAVPLAWFFKLHFEITHKV